MIESSQKGIYKIINECKKAQVPTPVYEFYWGGKEVHFVAIKSSEKGSEKILKLVSDNNQMAIAELALAVGITTRAIEKQISKLKNSKQLERIDRVKEAIGRFLTQLRNRSNCHQEAVSGRSVNR